MKAAKILKNEPIIYVTEEDLQRMHSFEEMLACNIMAAEESLEAAKKRHYTFTMLLNKFEEQNKQGI